MIVLKLINCIIKSIGDLIVPFIIAVGSLMIFGFVPQTKDVYRSIIEIEDDSILHAFWPILFVSILSMSVWYSSYLLYSTPPNSTPQLRNNQEAKTKKFLAIVLGCMPIVGLSWGIYSAQKDIKDTYLLSGIFSNVILLGVDALIIIICCYLTYSKSPRQMEEIDTLFVNFVSLFFTLISLPLIINTEGLGWGVIWIVIIQLLLYILLYCSYSENSNRIKQHKIVIWAMRFLFFALIYTLLIYYLPYYLPSSFSTSFLIFVEPIIQPIILVSISFTLLVVGFTIIQKIGDKKNFPAITFLMALIVFNGFTSCNDNHEIRRTAENSTSVLPTLTDSFNKWLDTARKKYPQGEPYPVYIVSAQGGGIYAAYHAATTLAKLTDDIPSFPQHIFAISGVSGGSLGASVFASLLKANNNNSQTSIKYLG